MVYYSFLCSYIPYFCWWGNSYGLLNPPAHQRPLQTRKPSKLRSESPSYWTPAPSSYFSHVIIEYYKYAPPFMHWTYLQDLVVHLTNLFVSQHLSYFCLLSPKDTFGQTSILSFTFWPCKIVMLYMAANPMLKKHHLRREVLEIGRKKRKNKADFIQYSKAIQEH